MRILVGVAPRAAKRAFARQLNRERGSPTRQDVGPGLQNFRNSQERLPLAWKLRGGQQQDLMLHKRKRRRSLPQSASNLSHFVTQNAEPRHPARSLKAGG